MPLETALDIGKIIKTTRKQQGLTQEELAAAAGLGSRFIRELEKGKASCQLGKALLTLQLLGIKLEAILPKSIKSNTHE